MIKITNTAAFTCQGRRENPEDFIVPAAPEVDDRIFVVCDGMGGHGHGEVASATVAQAVHAFLTQLNAEEFTPAMLQQATDYALAELKKADTFGTEAKAPGTTLVVAVRNRMNILVGHVGDSRCYLFDSCGEIRFRSHDHSKVQEAVDGGILTEEEAWSNPHKNIITRCLTSRTEAVEIEVDTLTVDDGDTMLLCTDGVNDALRDSELRSLIIDRTPADIVDALKTECDIKSRDNFSGIVLALSQDEENPKPMVETADDSAKCPYCHTPIDPEATFCPNCGAHLKTDTDINKDDNKDDNNDDNNDDNDDNTDGKTKPGRRCPMRRFGNPWLLLLAALAVFTVFAAIFAGGDDPVAPNPAEDIPDATEPLSAAPDADTTKIGTAKIDSPNVDTPKVDTPKVDTSEINTIIPKIHNSPSQQ